MTDTAFHSDLTYGQGAAAELVAAGRIAAADMYGSSPQLSTIRYVTLTWILTLPMAMVLSAGFYLLFVKII
jgi:PiT family inorganic phosphate transporter